MSRLDDVLAWCERGVTAESVGLFADADIAYRNAWNAALEPYERCLAAYHLARVQPTPGQQLDWNRIALDHASTADPKAVAEMLPSLQLAAASAARAAGDVSAARRSYIAAAQAHSQESDSTSGPMTAAIVDGLVATEDPSPVGQTLREIGRARRYGALSALLPGYVEWVVDKTPDDLISIVNHLERDAVIDSNESRRIIAGVRNAEIALGRTESGPDVAFKM
ncbi:hypothetical protein AAFP30_22165 [Gordonia sp. CPCC 205515]|uniref:hypothetical protein n=1 Tax=Gordonia sp. CPCC 205515 TaxID=3140791 RepID=UPI003AF35BBF